MKVVFISDIHANYTALESVMNDVNNADMFVCLGDIVGYGPQPKECVDLVRDKFNIILRGNHDREVSRHHNKNFPLRVSKGLDHAEKELDKSDIEWLHNLPDKSTVENTLIAHSHPEITDKYVYPRNFKYMDEFIEDYNGLALGHTHIQGIRHINGKYVFNPGSVGQPRDNNPKSGYAILDTETNNIELKRSEYDVESVVNKIKNTELPNKNGNRLKRGE